MEKREISINPTCRWTKTLFTIFEAVGYKHGRVKKPSSEKDYILAIKRPLPKSRAIKSPV